MKTAGEYRKQAKDALKGHWGSAVGTTFVASILGATINMGFPPTAAISSTNSTDTTDTATQADLTAVEGFVNENWAMIAGVLSAILAFAVVYAVISLIIGSVVSLGLIRYNLNLIDGKEASFGQLFGSMSMAGKAVRLRIRVSVFTFLWTLLLVIPGIVKSYSYSMCGFILAENPTMPPKEAMKVSQKMMKGHKMELFCLQLSYIGWCILGVITLGIGLLWVQPYMNAAIAAFYDDVSRNNF